MHQSLEHALGTRQGRGYLTVALIGSLVFHLCALGALAAWSVDRLVRSPRMGASPGVVVMEAAFTEPEPPPVSPLEIQYAPQEQVVIQPHRAETLTRRFVDTPAARVPLEKFLTRQTIGRLLESEVDASPESVEMEKDSAEQFAQAAPTDVERRPTERRTSQHRPTTAQTKAVVASVAPTPQTDAGLRTGPSFAGNRPPSYPAVARRNGWQGKVMLRLFISTTGEVRRVEVARSSGHAVLDAEAAATVRTWRGSPATLNGRPVATTELLPVRFRLK